MAFSCKVLVYFGDNTLIIVIIIITKYVKPSIIIIIMDGYFMKIMKKIRNRIFKSFSEKINFHEIIIIIIVLVLLFIFTPKEMKYKFRGCGRSVTGEQNSFINPLLFTVLR